MRFLLLPEVQPGVAQADVGAVVLRRVFKVFLSSDPLDLEDILTDNNDKTSRNSRGVLNNLAKIFKESEVTPIGTRGGEGKINTAQNGTIFGVNFTIVPKE